MNDEFAKTFSLMLKTIFFLCIGLIVYYYIPPQVWVWLKVQAEWGMRLIHIRK